MAISDVLVGEESLDSKQRKMLPKKFPYGMVAVRNSYYDFVMLESEVAGLADSWGITLTYPVEYLLKHTDAESVVLLSSAGDGLYRETEIPIGPRGGAESKRKSTFGQAIAGMRNICVTENGYSTT